MAPLDAFHGRSFGGRLAGLGQLLSAAGTSAARFSRRLATGLGSGPALSREDVRRTRLRVMFAAGGMGGVLASRYVNPGQGRTFHLRFHDLLALWSNNIIAWDEAMDVKELDREASLDLLSRSVLTILCGKAQVEQGEVPEAAGEAFRRHFGTELIAPTRALFYPPTDQYRFENYALACGISLGRTIEALKGSYADAGVEQGLVDDGFREFHHRCIALHHAQLTSLEQRVIDEQHQWPWYRDHLLDQKFNNILYAPLQLFIPLDHPLERREQIRRGLSLIGALFFHRQAIDDVLDIASDAEEGLAGAPAYILCSQGSLARALAPHLSPGAGPFSAVSRSEILGRVRESRLLEHQFSAWTRLREARGWEVERVEQLSADSLSHDDLELLVRQALTNDEESGAEAVGVLAARAAELHQRYRTAMEQRDSDDAVQALLESRAAHRILSTVEDPVRQAGIVQELDQLDHPQLRRTLSLYYRRCLSSYNAACRNLRQLERRAPGRGGG